MLDESLLLILSNALTGIAGWFVGMKRKQVDTDNAILKNMEIVITSYKVLIDDLKEEIHQLNQKVTSLESKVDELHKENIKLKNYANSKSK